jgi:hypothetical protein
MKARRVVDRALLAQQALNDAQRLRSKAEQARAVADQMTDPLRKRMMLNVAVSYVVLAQSADEQDALRRKD